MPGLIHRVRHRQGRVLPARRWASALLTVLAVASVVTGCSFGDDGETISTLTTTQGAVGDDAAEPADGIILDEEDEGEGFDTDQGDEAPEPVTDFVLVNVELPADQALAGTMVVALADVTQVDAPPVELERIEVSVNDFVAGGSRTQVFLPVPLDGSLDIAATAHVDTDSDGTINAGDWISVEQVLVTPDTALAGVFVPVQPV